MDEKKIEIPAAMEMLSDEQLEGLAGGRLTDGDRRWLNSFITKCKVDGHSQQEAIDAIRQKYNRPAVQDTVDEFVDYIIQNW